MKKGVVPSETDLVQEAYEYGVFAVFGKDPYTIPLVLFTRAWMEAVPSEERNGMHLWKYVRHAFDEANGHRPADQNYRTIMNTLKKREIVKAVKFQDGMRPKYDYELTEYGKRVCDKHEDSLREQIKLEKWRRRAVAHKKRQSKRS